MTERLGAAVLSGVLVVSMYMPSVSSANEADHTDDSVVFTAENRFPVFLNPDLSVQAQSVSDNDYSETQVDTSAGDVLNDTGHVVNTQQAEEQKQEEIQTNSISGWPQGPAITAGSAILIDADTGTVLYGKNIHQRMYPASTTKMLTCLIAAENLDLNDTITFSQSAIDAVPADGSNIGMSVGETITVEQALYGLMVGSANECANALAEKVSGSIDAFVTLMNDTAAQLGCVDSHFANTNGLFDGNHYTSAYDLSKIASAFFQNDVCRKVGNCASYHFEATATQPDDFTLSNKHELITGQVSYSGIIGGKTGYTSQSHENLVTGCIQNGTELIAVVMREDDPAQFNDTVTLFDYGYQNFTKDSVADSAVLPAMDVSRYLSMGTDLLGSSTPALTIADGGYVDLPSTASFSDLTPVYGSDNSIAYYFGGSENGAVVGTAMLVPASLEAEPGTGAASESQTASKPSSDTGISSASDTDTSATTENAVSSNTSEISANKSETSPAGVILQEEETDHGRSAVNRVLHEIGSRFISTGLNGTIYVNVSSFLITIIAVSLILAFYFRFRASALYHAQEQARKRRRRDRRAHAERNDYYENHRYDYDDSYDPYDPSDYYNGDDYDNGFSSSYTRSNNYRDDYYGRDSYYNDDDYDG